LVLLNHIKSSLDLTRYELIDWMHGFINSLEKLLLAILKIRWCLTEWVA
jgi:hypothetical protein